MVHHSISIGALALVCWCLGFFAPDANLQVPFVGRVRLWPNRASRRGYSGAGFSNKQSRSPQGRRLAGRARGQRTLEKYVVDLPELDGAKIAITPCPGKRARDLGIDLDELRSWGAQAIVTLVQDDELDYLDVRNMGPAVEARGMRWFHCPIQDFSGPGGLFESRWVQDGCGAETRKILKAGGRVVVHCRGGIGRAGTVASRLLVELGLSSPQDALRRVRQARPGAVETWDQERHVLAAVPVKED